MMTAEQRYFFDLTGYLHLRGVLVQASRDHMMPPTAQ